MSQSLVMAGCCCGDTPATDCTLVTPGCNACPTGIILNGTFILTVVIPGPQLVAIWNVIELIHPMELIPGPPVPGSTCQYAGTGFGTSINLTYQLFSFGSLIRDLAYSGPHPNGNATSVIRCNDIDGNSRTWLDYTMSFEPFQGGGQQIGTFQMQHAVQVGQEAQCVTESPTAWEFLGTSQPIGGIGSFNGSVYVD